MSTLTEASPKAEQSSPPVETTVVAASTPARAGIAAYIELTKPRITMLLLITCVAGAFCAASGTPPVSALVITALGLAMSSGGASALNHVIDRDIDRRMQRTASRPVAAGTVSALAGTVFGSSLMITAFAMLWLLVHPVTAVLAAAGGLFYVLVYTILLKRTTVQNIVIGGAAGAVPPLVGWSAIDPGLGVGAWSLFAIIFMWTPPHFWALALLIREDYARAGVPMLPVVAGEHATVSQIWWYSLALSITSIVPVALGAFDGVFLVVALALDLWLLASVARLRRCAHGSSGKLVEAGSTGHAAARQVFLRSMSYLALIFAAAVVDKAVWTVTLF